MIANASEHSAHALNALDQRIHLLAGVVEGEIVLERLRFLRGYMVQRYNFFACDTQRHPNIVLNA